MDDGQAGFRGRSFRSARPMHAASGAEALSGDSSSRTYQGGVFRAARLAKGWYAGFALDLATTRHTQSEGLKAACKAAGRRFEELEMKRKHRAAGSTATKRAVSPRPACIA